MDYTVSPIKYAIKGTWNKQVRDYCELNLVQVWLHGIGGLNLIRL